MSVTLIDYPMPYKEAQLTAILLNGRLPTVLELSKLSVNMTKLKNSLFWTSDKQNKSNVWCFDKHLDIRVAQHQTCEQINTVVIVD